MIDPSQVWYAISFEKLPGCLIADDVVGMVKN
jgi:hypothetical protein